MIKPECFYTRSDEEWKVVGRYDRAKYKAKCGSLGGTIQRLVPSDSSPCPLVFRGKDASFFQIQGWHCPHVGFNPASG